MGDVLWAATSVIGMCVMVWWAYLSAQDAKSHGARGFVIFFYAMTWVGVLVLLALVVALLL